MVAAAVSLALGITTEVRVTFVFAPLFFLEHAGELRIFYIKKKNKKGVDPCTAHPNKNRLQSRLYRL
jgi:hypothetical protein